MKLSRRLFLKSSAGASAAFAGFAPVWSHASVSVGDWQVDTLSDGNLVLPGAMVTGDLPADEVASILSKHGLASDQFTPDCNITLMRNGTDTVLFDVGAGANFQSSAGQLWEALDTLGVYPEDVTHVVFTHAHPDHLWGVLDDFDEPMFMNARHMIGSTELAYWLDPATVDTISPERQAFAAGALRYLTAIEGQLETFDDGAEVLGGITAREFGGHTPGHMIFDLAQSDQRIVVVGDVIGNHHLAFARPDWVSGSDQDQAAGVASRVRLIEGLAAEDAALIGYHLPYPGIGKAVRDGGGFSFVPA